MQLSKKALADLRISLTKEIGVKRAKVMSDEDLNHIGDFLLTIFSLGLKKRMNEKKTNN